MPFIIPDPEITFQTSRSGGPGGQHVNKAETRVEAVWNLAESPSLTETQKERLVRKLRTRIDGLGRLRVAVDTHRSQARNRAEAVERLNALATEALKVPKPRKKTKPSRAAREKRIAEKKKQAEKKKRRAPPRLDE